MMRINLLEPRKINIFHNSAHFIVEGTRYTPMTKVEVFKTWSGKAYYVTKKVKYDIFHKEN